MNIFNEEDDFLVSTPRDNYFAIAKNANANIVEMEFEKFIQRLAVAEQILEEKGLEAYYEKSIKSLVALNEKEFSDRVNGLFLELTGNIVTQCE